MEVVEFILKWVIGPIVSIVVTLLLSDKLKDLLAPLVASLGSKNERGVTGRWVATFTYGDEAKKYTEVIEIKILLGAIVGRIIPHTLNHSRLTKVASSEPLRLRGNIKDNRYFTGLWMHPTQRSHYHGAFELIVHQDGETMTGMWLGYSEVKNVIENGEWQWERLPDDDDDSQKQQSK